MPVKKDVTATITVIKATIITTKRQSFHLPEEENMHVLTFLTS